MSVGGRHATSVRRKNIRKSQSDVGMTGNSELLLFESFPTSYSLREEISSETPRLKRHMSEQTAQSNYDDEFDVVDDDYDYDYENRDVIGFDVELRRTKRNKENNRLGVNFTNVLRAALRLQVPKAQKSVSRQAAFLRFRDPRA